MYGEQNSVVLLWQNIANWVRHQNAHRQTYCLPFFGPLCMYISVERKKQAVLYIYCDSDSDKCLYILAPKHRQQLDGF